MLAHARWRCLFHCACDDRRRHWARCLAPPTRRCRWQLPPRCCRHSLQTTCWRAGACLPSKRAASTRGALFTTRTTCITARPSYAGSANNPYPPQMLQRTTVAVHTMQLTGDGATATLLVWVNPLQGGAPLPNVPVELWRSNTSRESDPSVVARGTTDADGLAAFAEPGPGTTSIAVQHEGQWILAGEVVLRAAAPVIPPQAALFVAHPLVRPGASVPVWGFLWQPTGKRDMRVPVLQGVQVVVSVANGFQSGAQVQPGPYAASAVPSPQGRKVNVTVPVDPATGASAWVGCTACARWWPPPQGCSTRRCRCLRMRCPALIRCSCCWSTTARRPPCAPPRLPPRRWLLPIPGPRPLTSRYRFWTVFESTCMSVNS